jgi:hypothetical protein
MSRRLASLLLCALLGVAGRGWAQTGMGTIQGTVKDSSGAMVPGAKVTLVQTQTGQQYITTTNGAGAYLFPSRELGPYQLTVEAPGMESWKSDLTLQAGQTAEVDAALKVGATTTQVTVSANVTPLVNTTDGTVATVVEHARIEQLPLNGRNVDTLVYQTTPGVEPEGSKVPSVYGVLYGSDLLQDGALLENRDWQKFPDRLPGLDTIEEFRAETSNSSSKMERPGTIMLITRHGTNQLHGSVFDTNRDSAIGVARARQDYYSKAPHLVRNEFGVSAGGPIDIPKLYNGKNKTFFFFSYEGFRLRQDVTVATAVPTAAMRNGDFSGLVDETGHYYQLYNPFTTDPTTWQRQPFTNNQIPLSLQSPLAKYLYSATPLPTLGDVNPVVSPNYFGLGVNNKNQNTSTLRLDHQLSPRDLVFFRFSHGTENNEQANGLNGPAPVAPDGSFNLYAPKGQNESGVLSWTHTYSPTFFGETLFTVGRDYHAELPGSGTKQFAAALGLPDPTGFYSFPRLEALGFGSNGMTYDACGGCNINIARARVLDVHENLTKTHGRHEFQFGGQLQYENDDTLPDQQDSAGDHLFDSLATSLYDPTTSGPAIAALPFTGYDAANLFLGVAIYNTRFNRSFYSQHVNSKMLYFQDNFKVNPRLTLNLGVRYEYNSPIHEADNSLVSFDPKTHAVVLQSSIDNLTKLGDVAPAVAAAYAALGVKYETPAQAGLPHNLVHSNYYDFNPRLGFAYRLTTGQHYSVLRGGFGMFAYPDSLRLWNGENQFTVPVTGFASNDPNNPAQSPDGLPAYLLRSVPTIIAGLNSQNALAVTANSVQGITQGNGLISYENPHMPTSRAEMWNLTYEKEIAPNTAVSAAYVGTHAFRINQYYSYNDFPSDFVWYMTTGQEKPAANYLEQPYDQTFGQVEIYQKTGWSNDNSFQVSLQHQYSKGYAFQVFYVLSNAFRAAGDGWRGSLVSPPSEWLPNTVPGINFPPEELAHSLPHGFQALNRLENYQRDSTIPKHHLQWNWIGDLPFGHGKRFGRDAHGFLNALIGGWQIAGSGSLYSRYFSMPTDLYGPTNPIQIYGKSKYVEDCRSGECLSGELWWNGYIPANLINQPGGVYGVTSDYKPFQTPMIPTPANGGSASDPLSPYYESNTICVNVAAKSYQVLTADSPCLSGAPGFQKTSYSVGPDPNTTNEWQGAPGNPFRNQYLRGPREWNMDASLFKSFRIGESVALRFNADFFNVFNRPGTTMPSDSGIITTQFSDLDPRVMQLTLRLTW